MKHELKIWPSQFTGIIDGVKRHEWRRFDRDFQVGDTLILNEYDPGGEGLVKYTGRRTRARVTWITTNFGVPHGWCVMTILPIDSKGFVVEPAEISWMCHECGSEDVRYDDERQVNICANGHWLEVPE